MSRIRALKILTFVVMGVIVARLLVIQIFEHNMWVEKAAEAHTSEMTLTARRGEIYMMDKGEIVPVVLNSTVYAIIVDPMVADEDKVREVIDENAKEYKVAEWDKVFENKAVRYFVVARGVPRATAEKIQKEEVAGLWFKEGNARVYPEGQMASQLLGFVNAEGVGQYGIEGALDSELSGKDGLLKSVVDVNNVALSIGDENVMIEAEDGESVVLSIDKNIQVKVEDMLNAWRAEKGGNAMASALVMEPSTGRILAMANVPGYDPADYAKVEDAATFTNYVTEVAYEPASVCKTFTFSSAIDAGVMTPSTTYTNTGSFVVDGFAIQNAATNQPYGVITMQTGLDYSLNTSSSWVLTLLSGSPGTINQSGREKLYDYFYNHFGLGKYTGIEVAESPGYIVEPNAEGVWALDLTYANMTFGQGINLTMVQVASAFSALVNGGVYHTPTVVSGIMGSDGKLREYKSAAERNDKDGQRIVSETTSATIREMLYGTRLGQRYNGADPAGYYVGGKSGTAQVLVDGHYDDAATGATIASYVGFGASNGDMPAYVLMVKLWGEGMRFEGTTDARPVWNGISNYLLNYLQVQPK